MYVYKSKTKYQRFITISIVALWAAMLFSSCLKNNIEQIKAFSHEPGAPEVVGDTFELLYSDSAVVRFRLKTPQILVFSDEEEPYQEFPKGLLIERYNHNMKVISRIQADYGKYYQDKNLWEAKHNVVAVTEAGDTLKTDELFLDEQKDQIYSNQFVKIIKEGEIWTGVGFEADTKMTEWKFYKPRGVIYVEVNE